MTRVSGIESSRYHRSFSVDGAKELISTCLDSFDTNNPDCVLLLKTISELTVMLNTAKYDYTVLENLITENEALGVQYKELKLKHIPNDVSHMSFRTNALQDKCEVMKEGLCHSQSISKPAPRDPRLPGILALAELDTANVNLYLSSKKS